METKNKCLPEDDPSLKNPLGAMSIATMPLSELRPGKGRGLVQTIRDFFELRRIKAEMKSLETAEIPEESKPEKLELIANQGEFCGEYSEGVYSAFLFRYEPKLGETTPRIFTESFKGAYHENEIYQILTNISKKVMRAVSKKLRARLVEGSTTHFKIPIGQFDDWRYACCTKAIDPSQKVFAHSVSICDSKNCKVKSPAYIQHRHAFVIVANYRDLSEISGLDKAMEKYARKMWER